MKNLKSLRTQRGLTQDELAQAFRISQQSICKYEKSIAEPDLKTVIRFADYFGVTVDYLVGHGEG